MLLYYMLSYYTCYYMLLYYMLLYYNVIVHVIILQKVIHLILLHVIIRVIRKGKNSTETYSAKKIITLVYELREEKKMKSQILMSPSTGNILQMPWNFWCRPICIVLGHYTPKLHSRAIGRKYQVYFYTAYRFFCDELKFLTDSYFTN